MKRNLLFPGAIACLMTAIALPLSAASSEAAIVDDFESGIQAWRFREEILLPETQEVKEGHGAARFSLEADASIKRKIEASNWSAYEGLAFWVYSPAPTPAVVGVALVSENPGADGWSYFYTKIPIDWSGWKRVVISKPEWNASREPSWDIIKEIRFAVDGWTWVSPSPGNFIILDDIRLLTQEQVEHAQTP